MNAEIRQPEMYFCQKCSAETETASPACPRCGKTMQTQSQIKSLGKLVLICGRFITFVFGISALAVLAIILFAHNLKDTVTALAALGLTGTGLTLGITAIFGGRWQAKHGRKSKLFLWVFIGLVVLMLILGRVFSFVKD